MKLLNFFKKPSKWCQNANALDRNGKHVSFKCKYPSDELDYLEVVDKMSLYGAVCVFYPQYSSSRENVVRKLRVAIWRHTGKNINMAAFNDDPKTTFEDIQRVIKIAISLDS
jgi:hypothetical protein